MLAITRASYLKMLLSEIAERVLEHKAQSLNLNRTPRDRAISRVLAVQMLMLYNWASKMAVMIDDEAMRNFAVLWDKNRNKNKEEIADFTLIAAMDTGKYAQPVSIEQVDEIINKTFGDIKQQKLDSQKSADTAILVYLNEHPEVAQRVTKQLKAIQDAMFVKARGNPKLGGFTRAMIAKGLVPEVARKEAQKQMEQIELEEKTEAFESDAETLAAIKKVYGTKADNSVNLLALFEPSEETSPVQPSSEEDFSEFDNPEDI